MTEMEIVRKYGKAVKTVGKVKIIEVDFRNVSDEDIADIHMCDHTFEEVIPMYIVGLNTGWFVIPTECKEYLTEKEVDALIASAIGSYKFLNESGDKNDFGGMRKAGDIYASKNGKTEALKSALTKLKTVPVNKAANATSGLWSDPKLTVSVIEEIVAEMNGRLARL